MYSTVGYVYSTLLYCLYETVPYCLCSVLNCTVVTYSFVLFVLCTEYIETNTVLNFCININI